MKKSKIIKQLQKENDELRKDKRIMRTIIQNKDDYTKKLYSEVMYLLGHGSPKQMICCPERKSSYLIFDDGHFEKVKLAKGEKCNYETALLYLLVKNTYDLDSLQYLIKNKKIIKPGEKLPIKINSKK